MPLRVAAAGAGAGVAGGASSGSSLATPSSRRPTPAASPRTLNMSRSALAAELLPYTPLSRELEARVHARLAREGQGRVVSDVTVREVSSLRQELTVPEEMRSVLALQKELASKAACPQPQPAGTTVASSYPATMPYRQRMVLLWYRMDGVDVCSFALYVQEYGSDAPAPNTRRVYVAYLDSVRFYRALPARTQAYHELLCAYLANARRRGFLTASIWSCPPQRGDGYIFHRHPMQQRTPTKERLRQWYDVMLEQARKEGTVARVVSVHDQFFDSEHRLRESTGLPPVFAGDFWVMEMPRAIKQLERRGVKKGKKGKKPKGGVLPRTWSGSSFGRTATAPPMTPVAGQGKAVDGDAALAIPSTRRCVSAPAMPITAAAATAATSAQPKPAAAAAVAATPSAPPPPQSPRGLGQNKKMGFELPPEMRPALSPQERYTKVLQQMGARLREARDEHMVVHFAPLGSSETGTTHSPTAVARPVRTRAQSEAEAAGSDRISCDFFDNRHGFLRMCQGNNFQVCRVLAFSWLWYTT